MAIYAQSLADEGYHSGWKMDTVAAATAVNATSGGERESSFIKWERVSQRPPVSAPIYFCTEFVSFEPGECYANRGVAGRGFRGRSGGPLRFVQIR
jgi:hypothetical protein